MEERKYTYNLKKILVILLIAEVAFWIVFGALWLLREEAFPGIVIDNPEWISFSFALPVLVVIYAFTIRKKNTSLTAYATPSLLPYLTSPVSTGKSVIKFSILRFGIGLLLVALANPKLPKDVQEEVTYTGMDIIIALDISKSMLAEDIKPNRLERAKLAINNLIGSIEGNRVGLVAFAGNVDNVFPLTTDYAYAKSRVSKLGTDYITKQGTDIGGAIETALNNFNFSHGSTKTIIVITDGEDHASSGARAAQHAVEMGVTVHAIGIGSPEGVPIPEYENGKMTGYKTDANGETVITKLNIDMLKQVAMAGQGSALLASGSQVGLAPLVKQLNETDKKEFSETMIVSYENQFQVFLALALLLLALEFFISERRSKFADSINLFET